MSARSGSIPNGPASVRIEVALHLPHRPARVTLEPAGVPLKGAWNSGVWSTTLPSVEIHSMLVW